MVIHRRRIKKKLDLTIRKNAFASKTFLHATWPLSLLIVNFWVEKKIGWMSRGRTVWAPKGWQSRDRFVLQVLIRSWNNRTFFRALIPRPVSLDTFLNFLLPKSLYRPLNLLRGFIKHRWKLGDLWRPVHSLEYHCFKAVSAHSSRCIRSLLWLVSNWLLEERLYFTSFRT